MGMSTNVTPKPDSQLWGIYHANREHARELGDPLRTVIEAPNKLIAEETAAGLGFGDPRAHPVNRSSSPAPPRHSGKNATIRP
jgi:hypothetical protein